MTKKCLARVNVFGYTMGPCDKYTVMIGGHEPVGDQCSRPNFQCGCVHHEPEYEDFDDWAEYIRSSMGVVGTYEATNSKA